MFQFIESIEQQMNTVVAEATAIQDAKWNEMMEEVIRNGKMEMRVLQETNSQKQSEIEKLRVGF